jgi:hypothetical protein
METNVVQMECFRIDESGYTGFDLMNRDQRFQGAAAIAIEDEQADVLIRTHFPRLQARELKHRALSRRKANHPRLLDLLRDVLSRHKCITYICDKRYLLTLMFVDFAVEPFYYERGIDIYEDGGNYAMASLLYTVGPTLFGGTEFDELLTAFQAATKEKSALSRIRLVSAARNIDWQQLPEILGPLALEDSQDCWDAIATPGITTDAAMVVLQSIISRTEILSDGPYVVEHDNSKNLLTYHRLIFQMINHDREAEFRPTELARLKFPLKLRNVTQIDSASSPAVQVADVMIGATLEAANNALGSNIGGLNHKEIFALYRDDQIIHMLPSIDFEKQRRFRKGNDASRMVDYFAKHFSPK